MLNLAEHEIAHTKTHRFAFCVLRYVVITGIACKQLLLDNTLYYGIYKYKYTYIYARFCFVWIFVILRKVFKFFARLDGEKFSNGFYRLKSCSLFVDSGFMALFRLRYLITYMYSRYLYIFFSSLLFWIMKLIM